MMNDEEDHKNFYRHIAMYISYIYILYICTLCHKIACFYVQTCLQYNPLRTENTVTAS